MIGVILAILHIMIAIYVAFRVFKQLYYMFENKSRLLLLF